MDPFRSNRDAGRIARLRLVAVAGLCGVALSQSVAQDGPAATPVPATKVSPYVLAARCHAREAASSEPPKVGPMTIHRPRLARPAPNR
ncbi:MAG: hypothetical protein ACTHL8_05180 [Burkholderiaceae bacterium]